MTVPQDIEFLTTNAGILYPFADEAGRKWTSVFVDATACADGGLTEARVEGMKIDRLGVHMTGSVGGKPVSGDARQWGRRYMLATLRGDGALLRVTLSADAVNRLGYGEYAVGAAIAGTLSYGETGGVTSVEVCSGTGTFDPEEAGVEVTGDLTVRDDYGMAVAGTALLGDGEQVIQVSAVPPSDSACPPATDQFMTLEGDDCLVLAAIPNATVVDGLVVPWRDDGTSRRFVSKGVIVVDSACTACCQCEDYKEAVDRLHELDERIRALYAELGKTADSYSRAVSDFNAMKDGAMDDHIDDYKHVMMDVTVRNGWTRAGSDKGAASKVSVVLSVFNGSTTDIGIVRPEITLSSDRYSLLKYTVNVSCASKDVETRGDGEVALAPGGSAAYMYQYTGPDDAADSPTATARLECTIYRTGAYETFTVTSDGK